MTTHMGGGGGVFKLLLITLKETIGKIEKRVK